MLQVFQRQFAGVPQSLAQVRRFVEAAALAAGVPRSLLDDLVLVGDELAGNAITHTESGRSGGTFSVRVDISADHQVTVHVRDSGSTGWYVPIAEPAADIAEGGRGLQIVQVLARHYGTGAAGQCACEGEPYLQCSWATLTAQPPVVTCP